MPQGDGKGPLGKGPGVGRGQGGGRGQGICRRDPQGQDNGNRKGRGQNQPAENRPGRNGQIDRRQPDNETP